MRIPRLSNKQATILETLLDNGNELYGLELVAASNGRLKKTSVYVHLHRMCESGLLAFREESPPEHQGGLPRPLYRVTGLGRRAYELHQLALDWDSNPAEGTALLGGLLLRKGSPA